MLRERYTHILKKYKIQYIIRQNFTKRIRHFLQNIDLFKFCTYIFDSKLNKSHN